jgi:hypothetical protein
MPFDFQDFESSSSQLLNIFMQASHKVYGMPRNAYKEQVPTFFGFSSFKTFIL